MTPIHIIGQPGAGKTTLVVDIVRQLVARGMKVGTIKHSSHAYELDKPGKDSFQHRKAGASPVSVVNREMTAIYMPQAAAIEPQALLETFYAGLDVVLIEGWISGPYHKIEVWRKAVERPPLFWDVPDVRAIVSDDELDPSSRATADSCGIVCLKRSEVEKIVEQLFEMM